MAQLWDERAREWNACLEERDVPVRVANLGSVWTVLYTQPGRYHWMLQYCLRAEGLSLGWIGTGRFIFSHATTPEQFAELTRRFLTATQKMAADGWWWSAPWLDARWIRRRQLRELLRAVFGRSKRDSQRRQPLPFPSPPRPRPRALSVDFSRKDS